MTASLARRERLALCDLALVLGPDVPTLCEGWAARDLVSHLLVRERQPISSLGNVVPPLSGLTERAMEKRNARPFEEEVEQLRSPSPPLRAVPGLDAVMNTFEFVVHHEDLRRAQPGWAPRELPERDTDQLWSLLRRAGAFLGRQLPVPTVVRRADTGDTAVLRKGDDPVTVTGPVVELVLFLFGRSAVRDLSFEGLDEGVAQLRGADLGI